MSFLQSENELNNAMILENYTTLRIIHSLCVFLVISIGLVLASPACGFQNGANGAHGLDGDPGSDGGHGFSAESQDVEFDEQLELIGGRGGNGGNGGGGIDGDDAGATAAGGRAGSGGDGGQVTASIGLDLDQTGPLTVPVFGGAGGTAGMFGRGTESALDGRGGFGGHGGNAHVFLNDSASQTNVAASGGDGGNAYGIGGMAGHGGGVLVFSSARSTPGMMTASTRWVQYGGDGGIGFLGAVAGNGASVAFEATPVGNPGSIFSSARGFNVHTRTSTLRGIAGNGGESYNGVAGQAGDAFADVRLLKTMLPFRYGSTSESDITLQGGAGGKGIAGGNQNVSGADGGRAYLNSDSTPAESWLRSPNGNAEFTIDLTGGRGGTAAGFYNQGNGGQGGVASLSPIWIDVQETGDNPAGIGQSIGRATARLRGGDGGHAQGTGVAGNGADTEIDNMITITANSSSSIRYSATGGDGGWGRTSNGHGGSATAISDNAISQPKPRESSPGPTATVEANGGHAGRGAATNQATGGDANAVAIDTTYYSPFTVATAVGGMGNGGKSGDALAQSHAISTGNDGLGEFGFFNSLAIATAKKSDVPLNGYQPTHGTNSTAEARASSQDGLSAYAESEAIGGWGSEASGAAFSSATADHEGGGHASSDASSFAFGDRDPASGNFSTSVAISRSLEDEADATSRASSSGHFGQNHAISRVEAQHGIADATTFSSSSSWAHSATVRSTATIADTGSGSASRVDASSYFGFRQSVLADSSLYESFAHALLIPDQVVADSMLASSGLTDVFVDDTQADILGIGSFGGGLADQSLNGPMKVDLQFDATLQVQDFYDDQNLMLGLFGIDSTGDGFTSLDFTVNHNDVNFIQETFLSIDEANNFLEDSLFDLGAIGASGSSFEMEFLFEMLIDDPEDSYAFNFVFGNAAPRGISFGSSAGSGFNFSSVPEPSGTLFIGTIALALFSKRRRSV